MSKKKREIVETFKSADKNGDGKIDLEEYIEHFKVSFSEHFPFLLLKLKSFSIFLVSFILLLSDRMPLILLNICTNILSIPD